jgi:hypothetical protein
MVSKLLLAVQETILRVRNEPSARALMEKYTDIRMGLSFNKSPAVYGAFPTDPYSHTPKGQGAKQPGMTGMVKEEILTRQRELGFAVDCGCIVFDFLFFERRELLTAPAMVDYWNVDGEQKQIECPPGCLVYSVCQVPVLVRASGGPRIEVHFEDGSVHQVEGLALDPFNSRRIFQRDGSVHHLVVSIAP